MVQALVAVADMDRHKVVGMADRLDLGQDAWDEAHWLAVGTDNGADPMGSQCRVFVCLRKQPLTYGYGAL